MTWSDRDSDNLERVAVALEKLINKLVPKETPTRQMVIANTKERSIEAEFFRELTQVYAQEEELKQAKNLKRKSGVRLSQNVTAATRDFFTQALSERDLCISNEGSLILVKKSSRTVACIRHYVDLGFHRGDHWITEIDNVVQQAFDLGISHDKVFIIVSSLINSIDHSHVKQLMGENVPDTASLLSGPYRDLLEVYIKRYVMKISVLADPTKQIFFLSADQHPNVAAWNFVTNQKPIPADVRWLRPSITELLNTLHLL